jgi:pimeloyl-ACP methyl ester carboxylesterase
MRERLYLAGEVAINVAEGPANGPPFVLLHGGSACWQYGATFIDLLREDWHVYAPDLRGHGASGRVPQRYRLPDYAADVAGFLRDVVQEPAVIYGHSLGGEVASWVAAQHPDLVRAVIVGDIPLTIENHPTLSPQLHAMNRLWHQLAGQPSAAIEAALREMPVTPSGLDEPQRAEDVFGVDNLWFAFQSENLHRLDPDVLAALLAGPAFMYDGGDPDALVRAIRCPVLLLQADPAAGGLLRDEDVAYAMARLDQPRHVRLTGIGHELHGPPNQSPAVLAAITPFIGFVRRSA